MKQLYGERREISPAPTYFFLHLLLLISVHGFIPSSCLLPIAQNERSSLSAQDISKPSKTSLLPRTTTQKGMGDLTLRYLQEKDLPSVVKMCMDEYGSSSFISGPFGPDILTSEPNALIEIGTAYEKWVLALGIFIGMDQRIKRQISGSSNSAVKRDHNVVCLVLDDEVIGMAEVSIQSRDPLRTSSAFVIPMFLKQLLFSGKGLVPYISNVLMKEQFRGRGFGKLLMDACEDLAQDMGFDEVYLHVDADTNSGKVAQRFYNKSGYTPVIMEGQSDNAWIGNEKINGIYMVEGVPLSFLRKGLE